MVSIVVLTVFIACCLFLTFYLLFIVCAYICLFRVVVVVLFGFRVPCLRFCCNCFVVVLEIFGLRRRLLGPLG